MKKYLSLLLSVMLLISSLAIASVTAFAEPDEASDVNKVDAVNSGFEGVTDVKETKWYKLVDSKGDSAKSDANYSGISIKTDGGHTGNNYLSMSADKSWHSPSINIYPFLKEAGAGSYIISFQYRIDVKHTLKNYMLVRGLSSDAYPDPDEFYPDIQDKGQGNYYANLPGSSENTGEEWLYYVSEPFEVVEEQFDGDHNWWFCLDNFPSSAFVFDIEDFSIVNEDDFEEPAGEETPDTELTYLTSEMEANIFPAVTPGSANNAGADSSIPTATAAPDGTLTTEENGMSTTTVILIAAAAFVVAGIAAAAITILIKKKNSAK